jgi:hypothetical protein
MKHAVVLVGRKISIPIIHWKIWDNHNASACHFLNTFLFWKVVKKKPKTLIYIRSMGRGVQ